MIIKDEEEVLDRVLSSVSKFADEIIIVDTGSSDNSIELAKKYTNMVYEYTWQNDFSKARNYSISLAKSDYFMWLDADDCILEDDIKKLINLKSKLTDEDVIMLPYNTGFDDKGNVTFSYYRERILKNNGQFRFVDPVHEVIVPTGKIVYKNINIMHKKAKTSNPKRNLNIYLDLKSRNYPFSARNQFYFACEYYYNQMYNEAIVEFDKYLDLSDGYIENKIQACINMCRIYQYMGDYTSAIKYAIRSFVYDTPRAEVLCELGYIYTTIYDYNKSIYYYKLAISNPPRNSGAFIEFDKYNYVPYIQLGICYYYLGNINLAYKYNHKALKYKSNDTLALTNEKFYLSQIKKTQ